MQEFHNFESLRLFNFECSLLFLQTTVSFGRLRFATLVEKEQRVDLQSGRNHQTKCTLVCRVWCTMTRPEFRRLHVQVLFQAVAK